MKQEEAVDLGFKYGGLVGFGYAYWTGAVLTLKAAGAAQLTSVSAFLFASPLPLSVVLPVAVPVAAGMTVGGGLAYGGYKLYGMLSGSQNVQNHQNPGQKQAPQNQAPAAPAPVAVAQLPQAGGP